MKIKSLAILCSLMISGGAFADGPGSIAMHQAGAGKYEVMPSAGYLSYDEKLSTTGAPLTGYKGTGTAEGLKAEYGINEMTSVGLKLGNYNLNTTVAPSGIIADLKDGGMTDPVLFVNDKMDMGGGTLRFGAQLGVGLGKHTYSSTFDENAAKGGTSLAPYVGYEMNLGPGMFGAKLSYSMFVNDRSISYDKSAFYAAYSSTASGGQSTSLDVFYEYPVAPTFVLGADLNWNGVQTTKETVNGVSKDDENGTAGVGGAIYGAYFIPTGNTMIALVPSISQMNMAAGTTKSVKTATSFYAGLAANFIF
jgi:hypothetical protein